MLLQNSYCATTIAVNGPYSRVLELYFQSLAWWTGTQEIQKTINLSDSLFLHYSISSNLGPPGCIHSGTDSLVTSVSAYIPEVTDEKAECAVNAQCSFIMSPVTRYWKWWLSKWVISTPRARIPISWENLWEGDGEEIPRRTDYVPDMWFVPIPYRLNKEFRTHKSPGSARD